MQLPETWLVKLTPGHQLPNVAQWGVSQRWSGSGQTGFASSVLQNCKSTLSPSRPKSNVCWSNWNHNRMGNHWDWSSFKISTSSKVFSEICNYVTIPLVNTQIKLMVFLDLGERYQKVWQWGKGSSKICQRWVTLFTDDSYADNLVVRTLFNII